MSDTNPTTPDGPAFDFDAYPEDTCFHERRTPEPKDGPPEGVERRKRKDRRRRIDPTTFEKQYTADELEFMGAMQDYKIRSGKAFPTYEEVLRVARQLGYRKTGETHAIAGLRNTDEDRG